MTNRALGFLGYGAALLSWVALSAAPERAGMVYGQAAAQTAVEEPPLIDTPPFDVVVLSDAAGGKSVKIAPLTERSFAERPNDSTKLEVVLLKYPERRYEILWRDIKRVDSYEQMIFDEAVRQLGERDFVTAFMNLSFLMRNYPETPNLEKLRREFLFQSATTMFADSQSDFNRYFQTMATLEELRATAADYEEAKVLNGLSSVTDTLLRYYRDNGDLGSAKKLLERLDATYGERLRSVVSWKQEFQQMAEKRRDEAKALLSEGKFRQARQAAIEMMNISAAVQGGAEIIAEIGRVHPMIRVAVTQRSTDLDPGSLFSWSARRAGALVYRPLLRFLKTGTEGGQYEFALGKNRLSEDHQQLTLQIDPKIIAGINGYELTQLLIERATPGSAKYDPSWAAIVKSISSGGPSQIQIQLQRPHVLPHALLQFSFPDTPELPSPLPADYRLSGTEGNETIFALRKKSNEASRQPVEVIEVLYDDPKLAINDLLRGEVDVLDQVYPGDARRISQSKKIRLGKYALPSVHMLVPVSNNPYLGNDKFRRALMYATNRLEILRGELLSSNDPQEGQLISGPFPVGLDPNDPLSYAYDTAIEPMSYDPRLAKLLLFMADNDIRAQSSKMRVPLPAKSPLRVGVPNYELARVAVQALIQQWSLVGVKAEMVLLPDGKAFDDDAKCDLVYLATTMWEPAIDIERLLGGNGPTRSTNPFIIQALTRLRQARSWREVRTALQDMHRLVDYHLPLLPLWQITDRFAYNPEVQGLSTGIVSLYQNISNWQLSAASTPVAALPASSN